MKRSHCISTSCCWLVAGLFGVGRVAVAVQPDTLPRDAEAGLRSIHVPEGYAVDLVAAEPHVTDPVAFDWDPRGRLFVVEMADYPMGVDGKGAAGGRVRSLEDRDEDGSYERSALFADGLNFPNGILTWRDGLIVTAAPDILFLRDTNGDGRADEKEILLTGLSEGNQQLRANGLRWGLDGWVYVAAGGHHGKYAIDTKIRSFRNSTTVEVGSRDFRFRPDTGEVEAQSGPTQFGRNRDDWGRWFGTQNARPLWHYVLPDHYLRRNPHLAVPDGRVQLPGPLQPPVYPTSRQQKRYHGFDHAGRYTSACSGMIYRDAYLFGGSVISAFACEPFHNVVQRLVLEPDGVTFTGGRAGEEGQPDFFTSNDRWCRPVMVRTGPDGALWVADMYRYMIEHPQWLPENGKEELLPFYRHGEDRGRIYRVRRGGGDLPRIPKLDGLASDDLARELRSANGWVRDKVQQILLWRGDRDVAASLTELVDEAGLPQTRVQALWTLAGLGALTEKQLLKSLADPHPGVRENALRMAEERAGPPVVAAALQLVDDRDAGVRMQLAFSIGEFPETPEAGETLAKLLVHDHEDAFAMIAAFSSSLPHLDNLAATLAQQEALPPAIVQSLVEIMLGAGRRDSLASFLIPAFERAKASFGASSIGPCLELLDALAEGNAPLSQLVADGEGDDIGRLREEANALFESAASTLRDPSADSGERIMAAALLVRHEEGREAALEFLGGRVVAGTSLESLREVIEALVVSRDRRVPEVLLDKWEELTPQARHLAIDALCSRKDWMRRLVAGLERSEIRGADLTLSQRSRLLNDPDEAIRKAASAALDSGTSPARTAVVNSYRPALELQGDTANGRAVFLKSCAACHTHGADGREVGPDLRTVSQHPAEKILVNILDPNLDIQPGYHAYTCQLKSGEQLFGMLASENAVSITLKLPDGAARQILRRDIASLKSLNISLMPEGLEAGLSRQEMADLISFLTAPDPSEDDGRE